MPGIPEGRTAKLADKTTGVVLKEGRYDAGAKISGVYENGNEVTYKITVSNTGSAHFAIVFGCVDLLYKRNTILFKSFF